MEYLKKTFSVSLGESAAYRSNWEATFRAKTPAKVAGKPKKAKKAAK